MKKLLLIIMLAVCSVSLWAKDVQTAVFTLEPPMHCQNCENKVQSNLRFEKGIKSIDASAQRGDVTIKYDPAKTNPESIVKAFAKIGYKATLQKGNAVNASCASGEKGCCKNMQKKDDQCQKKDGQCAKKDGQCAKKDSQCPKKKDCPKK